MSTRQLFDQTIGFLSRSLDLSASRHKIVSTNVANAETPNYKSMVFSFQKALERSIHQASPVQLKRTHPTHLSGDFESAPELEFSREGVNIDQEMANLAENNL
ncbi:MAG: flagellar basal body rod protein FlgB, partial [Candidatus Aminicenantes bacterium]|nr:flagellar basal body rod protein FlgB [Candidatus Aminicenantes bacterium]